MVANVTFSTSHQTLWAGPSHMWHGLAMVMAMVAFPAIAADGPRQEEVKVTTPPGESVANLPYARGRSFATLDEYLAHLESLGAIDLPWWREIRPGVYERVTSVRGAPPEVATREELMRRFGFSR